MSDIVERLSANVNWLMRDGFETSAKNVQCALAEIESLRQQLAEKSAETMRFETMFCSVNEDLSKLETQLAEMRKSYDTQATEMKEAWARNAGLLEQLAEKDAEIERLKEDGNMPVKYYQPNGKGQVYAVYGSSSIDFADSLLEQLAASQAREVRLREAVRQNQEWHENYDEYGGYPESELAEVNEKALTNPTDTTALGAMIAEAGEVMRERCSDSAQAEMDEQNLGSAHWHAARACREAIMDIPCVTLEDLK